MNGLRLLFVLFELFLFGKLIIVKLDSFYFLLMR